MQRLLPLLLIAALGSCSDTQHVGPDGFFAFAMTAATPPIASADDTGLYIVEQRVLLPIEAPTEAELAALAPADGLPFPRMPWVVRGDYEVEVDYVLINLDDASTRVTVAFDGINEFNEYMPGFIIDDDELIAELHQWERIIDLEPLERRIGTVREENFDEVAVDLATVVNGVTNAHQVVHPDNHSSTDRRSMAFVPAVVPALTGLRAVLAVVGEGEAPNVALEWTIRVRDERGVIVAEDEAWQLPEPAPFLPSSVMPPE
jgi:hypothetical protein